MSIKNLKIIEDSTDSIINSNFDTSKYLDFENKIDTISNDIILQNNFDNLKILEGVYLGFIEKKGDERLTKYGCTSNIIQRMKTHKIKYKNFTLLFFIPTPFYRQLETQFKLHNHTEPNIYNSIELIKFNSVNDLQNIYFKLILIHKQLLSYYEVKFQVNKWKFNYDISSYNLIKIEEPEKSKILYPNFNVIDFFKFKDKMKDETLNSIFA